MTSPTSFKSQSNTHIARNPWVYWIQDCAWNSSKEAWRALALDVPKGLQFIYSNYVLVEGDIKFNFQFQSLKNKF